MSSAERDAQQCETNVCLCLQLMFLAYLFFLVWLGVTAFTSLPVFMYFNVWSMCQNTSSVEGTNLCLDLRQFGTQTLDPLLFAPRC